MMTKLGFFWLSLISIVLIIMSQILGTDQEPGFTFFALGGLSGLVTWIMGAIKTAQIRRWGWMISIILFGVFATFIYSLTGPTEARLPVQRSI